MRFLLLPVGSHGDIHPYVALAHALMRRGHEALLVTNAYYEQLARDEGVHFIPLGERFDLQKAAQTPGAMAPVGGSIKLIRRLVLPEIPRVVPQLRDIAREVKPDAMVLHPLTLGAPSVCESLGIPWVGVALAPTAWWNPQDRPVTTPWEKPDAPAWQARMTMALGRTVTRWLMDPTINRVRKELGLPRTRDVFYGLCRGGVKNLGLWSTHFRGPVEGDPPRGVVCGFPWFDRVRAHDAGLASVDKFLDEGPPPLCFALGTTGVHVAGRFYHAAIEACLALGRRGVLLVGRPEYAPRHLPPGVRAFAYAPYSRVFPRCCAIVHHGGIGTTAQSLRAGVPVLVTPMSHDQFDNGARVNRLRVGQRLNHAKVTGPRLAHRLRKLLEDPEYADNARTLSVRIGADDGAERAALELEGLGSASAG